MQNSFPFSVTFNADALSDEAPWQLYQVSANFDTPDLAAYKLLSDKYSQVDWRVSLVDTTALIMKEKAPGLLDHIEFDEEGYLLDMYLDSEEALQILITIICPVFQQLDLLETYLRRVANRNKI